MRTGHEEFSHLRLDSPWFSEDLTVNAVGRFFSKTAVIPPGRHVIRFMCDAKKINAPDDPRVLVFRVMNFRLKELE